MYISVSLNTSTSSSASSGIIRFKVPGKSFGGDWRFSPGRSTDFFKSGPGYSLQPHARHILSSVLDNSEKWKGYLTAAFLSKGAFEEIEITKDGEGSVKGGNYRGPQACCDIKRISSGSRSPHCRQCHFPHLVGLFWPVRISQAPAVQGNLETQ